jgi:hypothetical protein
MQQTQMMQMQMQTQMQTRQKHSSWQRRSQE